MRRRARPAVTPVLLLLAVLIARDAAAAAPGDDLHGPISDFWGRVKRDWSRRIEGLNRGPEQTAIWVPLVWDGPAGDALADDIARALQQREARRWVRSQITRHRWSSISRRDLHRMRALRQNVILLGVPWDNDLVRRALEATPLRVERGRVSIGERRIHGDGLLVIALAPNPINPRYYALIITGTTSGALGRATEVPYGDTDYVVFRGRKTIERGFFRWSAGAPHRDSVARSQTFSSYFDWTRAVTRHHRVHYDPRAGDAAAMQRIGRDLDAGLQATADFLTIPRERLEPIDLFLYRTVDDKVQQTDDPRPAHVELESGELHATVDGVEHAIPPLAARVIMSRAAGLWGPSGERELPGLAAAVALACRERFEAIPLAQWASRSTRDTGYLPMDVLLSRPPAAAPEDDLSILDAAAFARDLVAREGAGAVARFYRTARRADFHDTFRKVFGVALRQAETRWLESLPRPAAVTAAGGAAAGGTLQEAMTAFRSGQFERAMSAARQVLAAAGASTGERAWARLTLGRAHAMESRLAAAVADLSHEEVTGGPERVRVLAAYWLATLGQPLNRLQANRLLTRQADADLLAFDWEGAESKLRAVLASDPLNREAHAALGQVYVSKYQYWHDFMQLDRELFPGVSQSDPETYAFLADKGARELQLAERMPMGEEDRWIDETGPVEPGIDQAAPHFLIGKARFLRGEMEAARRELETALRLEPRRTALAAYCRLYLGRVAVATDDIPEARAQFEAVLGMKLSGKVTKLAEQALGDLAAR